MNQYFLSPTEKGWELTKKGATRPSKRAETKAEMLRLTAAFMQGRIGSVKIFRHDGSVEEERIYPEGVSTYTA